MVKKVKKQRADGVVDVRGRAGTRRWAIDFNPRIGEQQTEEEFSPLGEDLLTFPAWADGKPGSRGRGTGVNR